jgi:hypothetical protein
LIVGDTHGNADWVRFFVFPLAVALGADAIIQLGDFGAWEHLDSGVEFMDDVGQAAQLADIPLYWLHGNHDKHSHTVARYKLDQQGFRRCRGHVLYIPQGHAWAWAGVKLRAFGGAYSVDKTWRVQRDKALGREEFLWFPEEEMTDAEMARLLAADSGKKDIVFSHDKPFSSKPKWNRKDIAECLPNQMRLERALRAHRPAWWFHGHLHFYYRDLLRGDLFQTEVVGLDPDGAAAEPTWRRQQTWAVADLDQGAATISLGENTYVDKDALAVAREKLMR